MRAADLPLYYNAVDILERNLEARAEKVALYSAERQMTFREVAEEANQVGNALKWLGVRFGESGDESQSEADTEIVCTCRCGRRLRRRKRGRGR